ncbi:alkaline phosphatase family protein [Vibrio spartinae]|uniref:Type I phosphodiesterase / nucleotide pyrophosphatase n=1 Tax=Vibrio spartinae TaxID=1918945 RepID=A0ABX6R3Z4_9VIBR|nr:alkaline phosphatase family protein [Vibrio spartinae]QMV16149.1 Type I phosphodiesterase / nucleotide pyrophosphatase [Vibrio spartinae]
MILEQSPNLTHIRGWVRDLIAEQTNNRGKSVVLLAVDGVRYADAERYWYSANHLQRISSVYPTTSSSCWLSSITGDCVERHGCVGVVFKPHPTSEMINVYSHPNGFVREGERTLFHDALQQGFTPLALSSDLGTIDCGWRERLLRGAQIISSPLHFHKPCKADEPIDVNELIYRLNRDIENIAARPEQIFGWIFLDLDRYIHRHGYDYAVSKYLLSLNQLASEWAKKGLVIAAHSDHGLVETIHSPALEYYLDQIINKYGLEIGGAGRTRWLYVPKSVDINQLMSELATNIPEDVEVARRSDYFSPAKQTSAKVGDILLIARSTRFITDPGILFDHGSLTKDEWDIPFAIWSDSR